MKKENFYQTQSEEEVNMKKYIVEAPEPKDGQKVSSGGIRENGRLTVQFKNPVSYEEQVHLPSAVTSTLYNILQNEAQININKSKIRQSISIIIWEEFGEPLLRYGFRNLCNVVKYQFVPWAASKMTPKDSFSSTKLKIIDIEVDNEVKIKNSHDKIIRFPNERAI